MPSHLHESLVKLLREQPSLAEQLLRTVLGIEIHGTPSLLAGPENFADIDPAEFRADAVIELRGKGGELERAVIFEVQLEWKDRKLYSWPAYVCELRARLRCPVLLVVVTMDPNVARRCAKPIDLDGFGGSRIVPRAIGPSEVPAVTDETQATAMPELAVLSVIAHAEDPEAVEIGRSALAAAAKLDEERARFYADLVYAYIGETARRLLEVSMALENYEFQSEFAKRFIAQGRNEGRDEGRAEGETAGLRTALLAVAEARGLSLTEAQRQRIEACVDPETLKRWTRAAAVATTSDALFADG